MTAKHDCQNVDFRTQAWGLRALLVSVGLLLAALLGGCGEEASAKRAEAEPLRIGFGPWPGFDIVAYAKNEGLFAKRGLDVELVRLDNQLDATRALYRGRLDGVFTSASDVMLNPEDGEPVRVVLTSNVSFGADGIVARPGIETVAGLAGQQVSAMLGTVNQIILYEALDAHGVETQWVDVRNLSNNIAYERFVAGELDAAVLWEPQLSQAAQAVGGQVIFRTDELDSLVVDILLTRDAVLNERREQLICFTEAWFELMALVDERPNEVFAVVAKELGQNPVSFASDYGGLKKGDAELNRRFFVEGQMDRTERRLFELFARAGFDTDTLVMIPVEGSVVEQALARWEAEQTGG